MQFDYLDKIGLKHVWDILKQKFNSIDDKIKEIELFKFPNATIIGQPIIQNGQISGFSTSNYLQFPFIVNFQGRPFTIDFCFTTGPNVTTQENILDSSFGLAFAIQNGHFVIAMSSNGTSWDLGAVTGTYAVRANTTYFVRIEWTGSVYTVGVSVDGTSYTTDISKASTASLYPNQMLIGVGDLATDHPRVFSGTINLNKCSLTISDKVVWTGMDDVGLATRMAVDMSNIDAAGEEKVKDITGVTQIKEDLSQLEQTVNGKYTKPSTGIPATDLAAGVIPPAVTDEHINSLIDDKLPTIPQKLPTPNKLTFTGAATGEFDGSSPLSIEIPQGGGGGGGGEKPWKLLRDITIPDDPTTDTSGINWLQRADGGWWWGFDTDYAGNHFEVTELFFTQNAGSYMLNGKETVGTQSIKVAAVPSYGGRPDSLPQPVVANKTHSWNWIYPFILEDGYWMSMGATTAGGATGNVVARRNVTESSAIAAKIPITALSCYIDNRIEVGFIAGSKWTIYGR